MDPGPRRPRLSSRSAVGAYMVAARRRRRAFGERRATAGRACSRTPWTTASTTSAPSLIHGARSSRHMHASSAHSLHPASRAPGRRQRRSTSREHWAGSRSTDALVRRLADLFTRAEVLAPRRGRDDETRGDRGPRPDSRRAQGRRPSATRGEHEPARRASGHFVRRDLARAGRLLLVPTLALLAVIAVVPGRTELAIRVYALVICGAALAVMVSALQRSYPKETPLRARKPRGGPASRSIPQTLARLEQEVALGAARRLRPPFTTCVPDCGSSPPSSSLHGVVSRSMRTRGKCAACSARRPGSSSEGSPAPADRLASGASPQACTASSRLWSGCKR